MKASPLIQWSEWSGWECYQKQCRKICRRAFNPRTAGKKSRIGKDIGSPHFIFNEEKYKAKNFFKMSFQWTSNQYKRTGLPDIFKVKKIQKFFTNYLKKSYSCLCPLWWRSTACYSCRSGMVKSALLPSSCL